MHIQCEKDGAVMVVALEGRLDTMTAPVLDHQVERLLQDEEKVVLLDLSGLDYISSAGLRSLLMLAKQLEARTGRMALCGLGEMIQDVFQVAGFNSIITICRRRADGIACLT